MIWIWRLEVHWHRRTCREKLWEMDRPTEFSSNNILQSLMERLVAGSTWDNADRHPSFQDLPKSVSPTSVSHLKHEPVRWDPPISNFHLWQRQCQNMWWLGLVGSTGVVKPNSCPSAGQLIRVCNFVNAHKPPNTHSIGFTNMALRNCVLPTSLAAKQSIERTDCDQMLHRGDLAVEGTMPYTTQNQSVVSYMFLLHEWTTNESSSCSGEQPGIA